MSWITKLGATVLLFLGMAFSNGLSFLHLNNANSPGNQTSSLNVTQQIQPLPMPAAASSTVASLGPGVSDMNQSLQAIQESASTSQATSTIASGTAYMPPALQKKASTSTVAISILDLQGDPTDYSRDESHVYFGGIVINGADPSSFALVYDSEGHETYFSKDKYHVYLAPGTEAQPNLVPFFNADPATFTVLSPNNNFDIYFKDRNHVYTKDTILEGANPLLFRVIFENSDGMAYGEDAMHVYALGNLIPGADPVSFVVLGDSGYSKDKDHVYVMVVGEAQLINGADPASFYAFDAWQQCGQDCQFDAQDKNHKYSFGEVVQ